MFADLEDEIEELFAEQQESHRTAATLAGMSPPKDAGAGAYNRGYRVFDPFPPSSPERQERMRKYMAKREEADIEARLLAGERPPMRVGPDGKARTGPKPVRWVRVAKRLGIDLSAYLAPRPKPVKAPKAKRARPGPRCATCGLTPGQCIRDGRAPCAPASAAVTCSQGAA